MSLKTREVNASLSGGYTSEGLEKDGPHCTFEATFSGLTNSVSVKLEESIDGNVYQEVPESATTLAAGETVQMWNDDMLPRGMMLRIVVGSSANGTITGIKLLSNG